MTERLMQVRALERMQRRVAELEQFVSTRGAGDAPDVRQELEDLRLITSILQTGLPEPSAAGHSTLPERIFWPADSKEMVLVPAGAFVLGADDAPRSQERPAHEVLLPGYYIDRTPVTVAEYLRFVSITGHPAPRLVHLRRDVQDIQHHPITGVSWHDAYAYAAWAGKRLPSEAEWEKAASWDWRTGTKRRFPWGDEWDPSRCNTREGGYGGTTPVGMFSPSGDAPCGAADMAGNVYEWTSSLNWNYPCRPDDGRDDPRRYGVRVRRGGAYSSEQLSARTTTRYLAPPDGLFFSDGFRCVAPVTD